MKRGAAVLVKVLLTASIPLTITVGAIVYAQQAQYYVLDGFGGVHAGGGAPA